ncbi:MAG TPA: IS110 family transposase [Vicinamibacteria bacterium]|nr:IS110 family transposase [Vicinamibacteria bacterium]
MMVGAIDIHKHVLHAAVLDCESGELQDARFPATRDALEQWALRFHEELTLVAIEATTGWRWVCRELQALGYDVRLADPGQAQALRGGKRRAKTDRLDARWLCHLLAKDMLPEAWLPPAEIQELRDRTRLRKALVDDRTRWAQRLHALLTQEGFACRRDRLLTVQGRRWAAAVALPAASRVQVDLLLRLIGAVEAELEPLERELRRFARADRRCQALAGIYGIGPILACHLLAELGEARRFRRARQVVRLSGLDPVVEESGETRRRGKLAKQGPPQLRWALVQASKNAHRRSSPDRQLRASVVARCGANRASLTVARKIARRAYHVLRELELEAA